MQFLFSAPRVLSAKKWRVVCASHTWVQLFKTFCSLIQAAFDLLPLGFSLHFSSRSSLFFCLPLHRFLTVVILFLAIPAARLPCAMQGSQDKETQFPYHHLLHFLQLPRCFPHGILVHPLSSFACWKWPRWVSGRVLSFIFLPPWSHFIAKIGSPLPIFFPHTPNKLNNSLHLQNLHFWPF